MCLRYSRLTGDIDPFSVASLELAGMLRKPKTSLVLCGGEGDDALVVGDDDRGDVGEAVPCDNGVDRENFLISSFKV